MSSPGAARRETDSRVAAEQQTDGWWAAEWWGTVGKQRAGQTTGWSDAHQRTDRKIHHYSIHSSSFLIQKPSFKAESETKAYQESSKGEA